MGLLWAKGTGKAFDGTTSTALHLPLPLHRSCRTPNTAQTGAGGKILPHSETLGSSSEARAAWPWLDALSELSAQTVPGVLAQSALSLCRGSAVSTALLLGHSKAGLAGSQPRI